MINQVQLNIYRGIIISSLVFTLAEHRRSTYVTTKGRIFQDKEREDVTAANIKCSPLCYDNFEKSLLQICLWLQHFQRCVFLEAAAAPSHFHCVCTAPEATRQHG